MAGPGWLERAPDGLRVHLKVTPGAGADAIGPSAAAGDGRERLAVRVTAAPEGGRANKAVIAVLAKTWRLPKSAFAITGGATGRLKTLTVRGDPDRLYRLAATPRD
ncbi:MAG: DUF167 family protein [Azospirillaceae bacterium]